MTWRQAFQLIIIKKFILTTVLGFLSKRSAINASSSQNENNDNIFFFFFLVVLPFVVNKDE